MQPLIGSRFTRGRADEASALDLCSECFLGQPEAEQAAFVEMTHPTQARLPFDATAT